MCVTLVEDGLDLMEQRLTLCRGKRLSGREGGVLRTDVPSTKPFILSTLCRRP